MSTNHRVSMVTIMYLSSGSGYIRGAGWEWVVGGNFVEGWRGGEWF